MQPQQMDFGMSRTAPPQAHAAPEGMQVEPSSTAAAGSGASAPDAHAGGAGPSSQGGASSASASTHDATMADPAARKPPRKHSDAPMRKLSISLIDTYKLINQV